MPAKRCPTYPNHRAKANLSDSGRRAKKKIEEKRSECVAPLCPSFFLKNRAKGKHPPDETPRCVRIGRKKAKRTQRKLNRGSLCPCKRHGGQIEDVRENNVRHSRHCLIPL